MAVQYNGPSPENSPDREAVAHSGIQMRKSFQECRMLGLVQTDHCCCVDGRVGLSV